MNQDSSFPPMLPPSTELGALLFAVLPCLQETYRPLASFAYHMTELTKLKNIPSIPSLKGLSGIEALITDKDIMLHSLSFYGRMFRMPLLSTIATLLQGFQFYQTYKDILPGLFSVMNGSGGDSASSFGNLAGLFSGLGGLGGFGNSATPESTSPDLFSVLGGLSPDLMSSLFSGFSSHSAGPASSTQEASEHDSQIADSSVGKFAEATASPDNTPTETPSDKPNFPPDNTLQVSSLPNDTPTATGPVETTEPSVQTEVTAPTDDLYNSLYSFLTPEQQKIYDQLMHTD